MSPASPFTFPRVRHRLDCREFHRPHVSLELVVLARIEAHPIHLLPHGLVVESQEAHPASQPLRLQEGKQVVGSLVLRPNLDSVARKVLGRQTMCRQFLLAGRRPEYRRSDVS